jgi:hypothetical protein
MKCLDKREQTFNGRFSFLHICPQEEEHEGDHTCMNCDHTWT